MAVHRKRVKNDVALCDNVELLEQFSEYVVNKLVRSGIEDVGT